MKRQMNKYLWMIVCVGISLTAVYAQRSYTLDECLEQALAHNLRLKTAERNLQMAKRTGRMPLRNTFRA